MFLRRVVGHSTDGERMHGWTARGWKSVSGRGRLSVRRVVEVRFGEGEAVRVAGCGWRGEDKFSPHVR